MQWLVVFLGGLAVISAAYWAIFRLIEAPKRRVLRVAFVLDGVEAVLTSDGRTHETRLQYSTTYVVVRLSTRGRPWVWSGDVDGHRVDIEVATSMWAFGLRSWTVRVDGVQVAQQEDLSQRVYVTWSMVWFLLIAAWCIAAPFVVRTW